MSLILGVELKHAGGSGGSAKQSTLHVVEGESLPFDEEKLQKFHKTSGDPVSLSSRCLELEGLEDIAVEASVQNVSQVIRKTKLSKIFGPLSVLNETNVDTV